MGLSNPRIALITTTIYEAPILRAYRHAAADVQFLIAGDRKTPHDKVRRLCSEIGNARYLSDEDQEKLGHTCSTHIGWDCIMRRNLALIEAIRRKADIIVTIDDDNIPVEPLFYFPPIKLRLSVLYSGLMLSGNNRWFNVGDLFAPPVVHRGFLYQRAPHGFSGKSVIDAKVGVVAGMWYGDPDINAVERIAKVPQVLAMSDLLKSGVLVDNRCFSPFNSQNTGYLAELAPLMAVLPAVGRYDDIWASYIAERVMMETGHHVFYGQPFTWQERNEQSVLRNLEDEIYGMRHTRQFCRDLLKMKLGSGCVVEKLSRLWEQAQALDYLPQRTKDFGTAWVKDLERVL